MDRLIKRFSKTFRYGQKGFTLIELLIVIAVLGILAAIAIPSVTGFITSGHVAAGNSEVSALTTAVQAWTAEHGTGPNCGITGGALKTPATDDNILTYMSGTVKYDYTISTNATTGVTTITGLFPAGSAAANDSIKWSTTTVASGEWVRA